MQVTRKYYRQIDLHQKTNCSAGTESLELVGLPHNINNGQLEEAVLKIFADTEVTVTTRNFHAIQ